MSTYINPLKPTKRSNYSEMPEIAIEFLHYSETIKNLSPRSINGYYIDLRTFIRFVVSHRNSSPTIINLNAIDISNLQVAFFKSITKSEIYEFLYYATNERSNSAVTRSRKLSSIKGFFKYLTSKAGYIETSPAEDIEAPINKKRLPKFLTLSESVLLLKNIQSDFYERDYCMITLLLNCGMRVSELTNIKYNDIKDDTLRIIGKGNKERIVYLNTACMIAISELQEENKKIKGPKNINNSLFISKRTCNQLSVRRVQQIIDNCFKMAGLDGKGYSAHKLRHTAATLLYQHGKVDILALKEILGHENVSTTQIYTHLDTSSLREAAAASPLANFDKDK